jgi:predicted Ser/Thr protein kinase
VSDVSVATPRDRIAEEQNAWDRIVATVLDLDAELVGVSRYIGDSRVYMSSDKVAKIRSKRSRRPEQVNSLAHEAEILRRLGEKADHVEIDDWEALILDRVPGVAFGQLGQPSNYGILKRMRILGKLIPVLRELHRSGVSHGDLRPENILVGDTDEVALIDYDRAKSSSRIAAALRDWIGIGPGGISANPYWKLVLLALMPKLHTLGLRTRGRLSGAPPVSDCEPSSADLQALSAAWKLAQTATANAPGQFVAYYALTYRDCHFTGERPWYLRWEAIRRSVDFKDKSVLELGCNMGLLSTFAMLNGARSATGVDVDPTVVESAKLVATALQSGAIFKTTDLVTDVDWETDLGGHDIVIAMSLVHWLPDQERVLRFLGKHSELIYEGHDSFEVETERLRSIGFQDVTTIARTERGRHVFLARRIGSTV